MGSTQVDYARQQLKYNYPWWMRIWYGLARWLYFKADKFYSRATVEKELWRLHEVGVLGGHYHFWRRK